MIHVTMRWWVDPALFFARALVRVRLHGVAARLATYVLKRGITARVIPDQVVPDPVLKHTHPATAYQPGFGLIH